MCENNFKIVYSKDVQNINFLDDILKLDKEVYEDSMLGTKKKLEEEFMKNKESYILLYNKEQLIGYKCFFPVTNEAKKEILTGEENFDDNITNDDICEYGNINNLFLISIVISKKYQNTKGIVYLNEAFKKFLLNKNEDGKKIKSIMAIAVSGNGVKYLERNNFKEKKKIDDNHKLYVCDEEGVRGIYNGEHRK